MSKSFNQKQSRRRNKVNNRGVPKQDFEYELVDGNWSDRPVAYCTYYKGYLTKNQAMRHNCIDKKCPHYHIIGSKKTPMMGELPEYKFPDN